MYETIILSSTVITSIFCLYFIIKMIKYPSGNKEMIDIANIIESCAKAYLKKQYTIIFIVSLILSILIFFLLGKYYVLGFLIGAIFSGFIGYTGMLISVKANIKTANAARISSLSKSLEIALKSGCVIGLMVSSLSLFSIFIFYYFLMYINFEYRMILNLLLSLGFGASLISIFARLGGGIFTKSADIGADLVGKLEINIPEDDPRNPAVIADNVGDNVGDCAGMAADLYETCCVTIIASIVLLSISSNNNFAKTLNLYPLILCSISTISTIIGILLIKLSNEDVMKSLYRCFFISMTISLLLIFTFTASVIGWNETFVFSSQILKGKDLFYNAIIGLFLTAFLMLTTEYYTSTKYFPVKNIAKSSLGGHAPNIIQGLAFSMESTAMPVMAVILSTLISYNISGIIGISIAASSMISLSGIIITLDAYGPITDNAGGIAEMAKLEKSVRKKTDILDSVGNTTKAITKGYAIGSAGLGSLVLFITYIEDINFYFKEINMNFSLQNPIVISGLFFGGIIPYIFSSCTMKSVGNVAQKIAENIRNQFIAKPGLLKGSEKPDYIKVINILTKESIKEMILPAMMPVLFPILLFIIGYFLFGINQAFVILGSMLLGVIIVGIFLAISMTSGGGAWDNAKKYIENGNFGGKGSDAHKAAITGDMVGDPYKDTAGPAINPLIKVINIISLLIIMFVSKM